MSGEIGPGRTPLAPIRSIESSIRIEMSVFRTASYQPFPPENSREVLLDYPFYTMWHTLFTHILM